uniref:hypothetical protein n=1 Tax=Ochrobactrum sp. LM19 TaxID=1449781 RepID=UPI0015E7F9BA|nr:hypothetical protein [Ochrobactrum sp. LM19]
MKYIFVASITAALLAACFFISTWQFPYELGWDNELLVGFYRFHVVTYDVVDYGGPGSVWVYDTRGDTWDFMKYCMGLKASSDFGVDEVLEPF